MERIAKLLLYLFISLTYSLTAQEKPDFFPEDISPEGFGVRCYCSPGVYNKSKSRGLEVSYSLLGSGTFEEEGTPLTNPLTTYNSLENWRVKLKVPLLNKPGIKILLGYNYESERYTINQLGNDFSETFNNLDANTLKSNSFSIILNKPINEKYYLVTRLRYTSSGNYPGWMKLNSKTSVYKFLSVFGVKVHDDLEWGIGLNFSKSFRRTNILPFVLYNRNFGERWGIESVLPALIYLRYNLDYKTIFLFGPEYDSNSYRLDINSVSNEFFDYAFNHTELRISAQMEKQLFSWIWLNIKAGFQKNFRAEFDAKNVIAPSFTVDPSSSFFFRIGIFLSPSDEMMNK